MVKGVQCPSRGAHVSRGFGIAPACWSIVTGWLFEDERGGCRWTVCVSRAGCLRMSEEVAGGLCVSQGRAAAVLLEYSVSPPQIWSGTLRKMRSARQQTFGFGSHR